MKRDSLKCIKTGDWEAQGILVENEKALEKFSI
jgi:hypothetical protein